MDNTPELAPISTRSAPRRQARRESTSSSRRTGSYDVNNQSDAEPEHHQDAKSTHHGSVPLHRAGLLQPQSYKPSSSLHDQAAPHSQNSIRSTTMELSNMMFPHPQRSVDTSPSSSRSRPSQSHSPRPPINHLSSSSSLVVNSAGVIVLSPSSSHPMSLDNDVTPLVDERHAPVSPSAVSPSGLSLLRPNQTTYFPSDVNGSGLADAEVVIGTDAGADSSTPSTSTTTTHTATPTPLAETMAPPSIRSDESPDVRSKVIRWDTSTSLPLHATETSSLLGHSQRRSHYSSIPFIQNLSSKSCLSKHALQDTFKTGVKSLPAVLLGSLLNILDGVSYGMIIFPAGGVFADLGPMGVSMFFFSAVIAQLTYTFGGSSFAGANGSMMIEVVPFFHILANSIAAHIGEDGPPREIIATTLVSYAFSSILTGLTFFLLGALKLGVVIGFFPRHILVGCIGGVGMFLIETGLTVSMGIDDDDFQINWETFDLMFKQTHNLILWSIPLALAILLRLITHKWNHQLVFPLYFIVIPVVFYIVVAGARMDLGQLRSHGWIFDIKASPDEKWYEFYSYLNPGLVHFDAIWATLPTQLALLFFNILHPPLNVPALSVSLSEDVDTDKELVAHGYSNLLAGIFGTVPNYLVYVNTLLFYRVGGGTRIAGFMLAVATAILLMIGTGPIAYIPVMVVGALIFVLGIDLVKEALWDTRHRVSRSEFITIASIMVVMTVWDFVVGVLFGIVVSCFFFVVQNSHRRSIRALHTGESAMSTVRRPSSQRAYIKDVSKQTTVLRLQGYLFFGTITYVEEAIRNIISGPPWLLNPVRFLVVDLTLVAGVDMSSAEAFVRILRLLSAKHVTLVLCGFSAESAVGKALQSVDILTAPGVELFSTFNDAMEWTENAYLRAWFRSQKSDPATYVLPGRIDTDTAYQHPQSSLVGSPRISHLQDAGSRTIAKELQQSFEIDESPEPYNSLARAFSSFEGDENLQRLKPLAHYLQQMTFPEGHILWSQGDPSDGLYIIESGVLRASYRFSEHTPPIDESMVPGTIAGELSFLSYLARNATVSVERPAVLWKLSRESMQLLESNDPELGRFFVRLVLKTAKNDYDILLAALASRQ